jgi:hypothetical protein
MEELVTFGSASYYAMLFLLLFARGMDFLSTWIATPTLSLEANPFAKKMGWRLGILINLILCFTFAFWPLPALVIITSSVLVASRNFQYAWMMRSLGETRYRSWVAEALGQTSFRLYLFCLLAQSFLFAGIGAALMFFSHFQLVPFAVGLGMITYALAVTLYTLLASWRIRRARLSS